MKSSFYVTFDRQGFVAAYKTDRFNLRQGEYATRIDLEVPDEALEPAPVPTVRITLPAEAIRRTFEASVTEEVTNA